MRNGLRKRDSGLALLEATAMLLVLLPICFIFYGVLDHLHHIRRMQEVVDASVSNFVVPGVRITSGLQDLWVHSNDDLDESALSDYAEEVVRDLSSKLSIDPINIKVEFGKYNVAVSSYDGTLQGVTANKLEIGCAGQCIGGGVLGPFSLEPLYLQALENLQTASGAGNPFPLASTHGIAGARIQVFYGRSHNLAPFYGQNFPSTFDSAATSDQLESNYMRLAPTTGAMVAIDLRGSLWERLRRMFIADESSLVISDFRLVPNRADL